MRIKSTLLALLSVACLGCFFVACNKEEDKTEECKKHTYELISEKAATCLTAKEVTYECSKCKATKTDTEGGPFGHAYNAAPDIDNPPSCVSYGEKFFYCTREGCNDVNVQRYGEVLGHDYQWVEPSVQPTCDAPQYREGTCSRCSNKLEEKLTVPHVYELDGDASRAASCTVSGKDVFVCSECNDTYEELLPATGHTNDGTKNQVVEPTCLVQGHTVRHCQICDNDYDTDFVPVVAHTFVNGFCTECLASELDVSGRAVSSKNESVTYLQNNTWELTGIKQTTFMDWSQIYFTVSNEKLQEFRDAGFDKVTLTLSGKAGQKTWAQVYDGNDLTATGLFASKYLINEKAMIELKLDEITEDLYYCLSYRSHDDPGKSDGAILVLEGVAPFKGNDQTTWYATAEAYEAVDGGASVKFSKEGTTNAQIGVTVTAEAIAYLRSQGHTKLQFTVTSDTARIEVYRDCLVHAAGVTLVGSTVNGSYTFTIDITETNVVEGQQLLLVPVMRSETTVTGSVIVSVEGAGMKVGDQATWYDTSEKKESVEDGAKVKFSKEGTTNAQIGVTLTAETIAYFQAQGYTKLQFTVTSDTARIEVYRDCLAHAAGVTLVGSTESGSYSFTVDITAANVANGQQLLFVPTMRSETEVVGTVTVRLVGLT